MTEILRMSEDTWFAGIHRQDTDNRPTYVVECIPAGGFVSIPLKDGFITIEAQELYFRITNTMNHSSICVPLSQIQVAAQVVGVCLQDEPMEDCVPVSITKEELYEKSKVTGVDPYSPVPGGGYICRGCSQQKSLGGCLEPGVKLERFNDNLEYCSKVL